MLALTLKNLAAHKMRLASTALAVMLGVAFMAGTLVFTDTVGATFDNVLSDANDGVDAMVRAPSEVDLDAGQGGAHVDAALAERLENVRGVDGIAVQVSGYAQLVGPDGKTVGDQAQNPALGLNWVDDADVNPYRLVSGAAPSTDDEIVIDRASASSSGYQPGDTVTVLTPAKPHRFTVSGLAGFGTADSAAGASTVLFTDDTAMELFSTPGKVDGIAVTASDGVAKAELVQALASAAPDDVEVVTGDQVVAEDQATFGDSFGPFRVFMLVFAFVAVFVGAFIINNTFSISVAQRSREMAMLRAIGAGRGQVLRSVLTEALAIGVAASLVGLAVGIGVARGLSALIGSFGLDLPDGPMVVDTTSMALSFAVGVGVTVVSAVLPARRAGRIRPIAALREAVVDRTSTSRRRPVIGAAVTGVGVAALLVGLSGGGIELVGVGALVTLVGMAVVGPVLARPVTRVLGLPLRRTGVAGQLATENAMRNPKRTARTASSLMIGVALVTFVTVLAASVRTSFDGAIDTDFRGTHVVDSGVSDGGGGLSPELADTLRSTPGVRTVAEARTTPAVVDGTQSPNLFAFDTPAIAELFDLGDVEGSLDELGTDGIAVAVDHARDEGWRLGSRVTVVLPTGSFDFVVRALYEDDLWIGQQLVDVAAFDAHLPSQLDTRIYADADDNAIRTAAAAFPSAEVLNGAEFADSVNGEIDQILGLIYALLALAVVIALFGIANTLALSTYERTRELGLLRAVGMVRTQLRATVRGEAMIVALFGTAMGIVVGTFFGWATVRALADEGIDTLTVPAGRLAIMAALAAAAGAIAAILPARRAARMDVLQALATH